MLTIYFDTFINSRNEVGNAPRQLRQVMRQRNVGPDRIALLKIGEQRVFPAAPSSALE